MKFPPIAGRLVARFLRGFVAGAVTAMLAISIPTTDWEDVKQWGLKLLFACVIGGGVGGLQALDLAIRNINDEGQWTVTQ
jgi:hypothetical protein